MPVIETNEHTIENEGEKHWDFLSMDPKSIYIRGKARVRFTRYYPRDYRNHALETISSVINYFPELWNRTVKVGFEGAFVKTNYGGHFHHITDTEIYISLIKYPDEWLVAHELMHGLQRIIDSMPKGEKACDLYCLARTYNYVNRAPSYLEFPDKVRLNWLDWIEVAHFIAKDAVKKREKGRRHYIKWFEEKIEKLVEQTEKEDK